jgi:hypothetical protein
LGGSGGAAMTLLDGARLDSTLGAGTGGLGGVTSAGGGGAGCGRISGAIISTIKGAASGSAGASLMWWVKYQAAPAWAPSTSKPRAQR